MMDSLFPPIERDPIDDTLIWLSKVYLIDRATVEPIVRRIYAENQEPFERCKCLVSVYGKMSISSMTLEKAEALGLFDDDVDYHTVGDRLWAMRNGYAFDDAMRMAGWHYLCGRPDTGYPIWEVDDGR